MGHAELGNRESQLFGEPIGGGQVFGEPVGGGMLPTYAERTAELIRFDGALPPGILRMDSTDRILVSANDTLTRNIAEALCELFESDPSWAWAVLGCEESRRTKHAIELLIAQASDLAVGDRARFAPSGDVTQDSLVDTYWQEPEHSSASRRVFRVVRHYYDNRIEKVMVQAPNDGEYGMLTRARLEVEWARVTGSAIPAPSLVGTHWRREHGSGRLFAVFDELGDHVCLQPVDSDDPEDGYILLRTRLESEWIRH